MLNYKHILYAIEHDIKGNELLKNVIDFAKKFDAEITLVHVVKPIVDNYVYADGLSHRFQKEINANAKESMYAMSRDVKFPIERVHILHGEPTKCILKFAQDNHCDVIILNGHSHNIFGRFGSVANDLINKSELDVIILKA